MKINWWIKYLFQALGCEHEVVLISREQRKKYIKMNNKKRRFIWMRIIDIRFARDSMNKSVPEIYKEENIYFEQVFYIFMLSLY